MEEEVDIKLEREKEQLGSELRQALERIAATALGLVEIDWEENPEALGEAFYSIELDMDAATYYMSELGLPRGPSICDDCSEINRLK